MRMDFSAKYRRSIRWRDGRPVLIRMDIDQLGIWGDPGGYSGATGLVCASRSSFS